MKESKQIKAEQLGMNPGTAQNRLRKSLLFYMAQKLEMDYCFQCGSKIETEEELSIEHKIPWLHSEDPKKLYFDLDNIAFSHLSCNRQEARVSLGRKISYQKKYDKMIETNEKKCGICKKVKSLEEFSKDSRAASGYKYHCKSCRK